MVNNLGFSGIIVIKAVAVAEGQTYRLFSVTATLRSSMLLVASEPGKAGIRTLTGKLEQKLFELCT